MTVKDLPYPVDVFSSANHCGPPIQLFLTLLGIENSGYKTLFLHYDKASRYVRGWGARVMGYSDETELEEIPNVYATFNEIRSLPSSSSLPRP